MDVKRKKLDVVFYKADSGNEPVRDWLQKLSKDDKRLIGEDILTVQYGWPIGMPLVKNLNKDLWEVRTTLTGARTARIIFFMDNNTIVLVNGFIKKTRKAPKDELDLSLKRKNNYLQRD